MVRRTAGEDTLMAVGDSVRFQAQVEESVGQTRLTLSDAGTYTRYPGAVTVPPLFAGADSVRESTEGVLVELRNVTVSQVIDEQTFRLQDSTGIVLVERSWPYAYVPFAGETMFYVRGIVAYRNGNFTLNPRSDADFGPTENRAPFISNVDNFPDVPTAVQTDTVIATVYDANGVGNVSVFYRFGDAGGFSEQTMWDDGTHGDTEADDGVWTGVIPAGPARTTAYYYIRAADVLGAEGFSPAGAPAATYSYYIRSATLSIFDLQYVGSPTGGQSPYRGQTVTVTGIVTGTNYGSSFYMSDPGGGPWTGIYVYGPSLTPAVGDCVRVTGEIIEYNDAVTEFEGGSQVLVLGRGTVPPPLDVRVGIMRDSAEAYEGCLVRLDTCRVTSIAGWGGSFPVFEVGSGPDRAIIARDAAFEYVPVVGDSFHSIVGCVDYYSANGWEISPRSDADIGYIDRRPPQLVSVSAVMERDINIRFNEPLGDAGIADVTNYTLVDLSDPDYPELHIEAAYLFSDRKTLHVTTMEVLEPSRAYHITINRVEDTWQNELLGASMGFGGYLPGVYTPIAALYDSFEVYDGRTVVLRGIVSFVQDVTTTSGSRRISAFMQDESGRGFSLSQTGAASTFPGIRRGNFISIQGLVNVFQGTIQLGSFTSGSVTVLAENVPLPDPIVVGTGDYRRQRSIVRTSQPGSYGSGTWVQTTGTIYRVDENVGGGTNIAIDDGSGNLTIRIWDSMNLDSVQLNQQWFLMRHLLGKTVSVAGPSSTYNGDFQMLAGYAEDFTARTLDIDPSARAWLRTELRPFAPDLGQTLKIEYNAPALAQVRLRVFDLRGRLIHTLADKAAGGPALIEWNGRDDRRELVPLGTYILHLECVENGDRDEIVKPIVVGTKL